jgi:uridine kinase
MSSETPQDLDQLERVIRDVTPPPGVRTRIVAIDGPGAAGKSSLAGSLRQRLMAQVIHTDDFASWDNPLDWWPDFLARVLKPLASGKPVTYRPRSWDRVPKEIVAINPHTLVIVEGVGASRKAFRPYLAFSIWIETAAELRLRRGVERDGEEARELWRQWMSAENEYVASERPSEYTDLILRGDRDLWR